MLSKFYCKRLVLRTLFKLLKSQRSCLLSTTIVTNEKEINLISTRNHGPDNEKDIDKKKFLTTLMIAGFVGGCVYYSYKKPKSQPLSLAASGVVLARDRDASNEGEFIKGLPLYTMEDVAKHSTLKDGVWVTYKRGVYDITSFINVHPGGAVILLAAGGSIEPFWLLYAVHNNKQVLEMLHKMRIGNLSDEDARTSVQDLHDPYASEPKRHTALKATSSKPFNAEPPAVLLVDSFNTPNELFYVRNHLPVPKVDPKEYKLELECEGVSEPVFLTLEELKNEVKFPKYTIVSTIMCAGNRRSEMTKVKPVKGLDWQHAAVGNATWSGARLADVLESQGIYPNDKHHQHIHFEGLDTDASAKPYGASIPAWKAFDKRCEILLAYEMNGEPLSRDHGYPIRVIVPGVVGARNVKWLGRIRLAHDESDSHWQQNDYKGFSPSTDWDTVDFSASPAIQEMPVTSAICRPAHGDTVDVVDGMITVRGYAWAGGGQKIVRVDVTADGGETWHVANIQDQDAALAPYHWAWTLWSAKIPVSATSKSVEIWCKAVDSNYNSQPESFKNIWNLRGVLSNAYHRINIDLNQ